MQPRFVGRLGPADVLTLANAVIGFIAVVVAFNDVELAARLILLAAIADGLDGAVARYYGGSEAGPYLDSLADVASFVIAPAVLVYSVAVPKVVVSDPVVVGTLIATGLFVAGGITRLGLYTAYDTDGAETEGVQSTLAATVLAAGLLAGVTTPAILVASAAVLAYLMITTIPYPDLLARDAVIMGAVHGLAILFPTAFSRSFPFALLLLALSYLLAAPWLYWRSES